MSEVQGREETRTGEQEEADAGPAEPAGAEAGATGDDARERGEATVPAPRDAKADDADEADGTQGADDDVAGADDAASGGAGAADEAAGASGTGRPAGSGAGDVQRVKIKMPAPQALPRSEFTPHALGAKGMGAPRSGTRAAARRRRIIYGTGVGVVVALLVGAAVWYETRPEPAPTVKGAFGKSATLTVPRSKAVRHQQLKEPVRGTGAAVGKNDFVVAELVAHKWNAKGGGKEILNTYKKGKPVLGQASALTGLPALDKKVVGLKAGTRLVLTVPYNDVGGEIAPELQLARGDDLVVMLDVLQTFGKTASAQGTPQKVDDPKLPTVTAGAPGTAPTVKIPSTPPPGTLQVRTLIQGSGPVVAKGKTLVVQYHGVLWRGGKVFDSTWQRGTPFTFQLGSGNVIPGWDTGLVGQKVGSRVLLVVPPKEGYGSNGSPDGGIKGTDTLVFVVDILGAY